MPHLKIPSVTINGHKYVTDYGWDYGRQRYLVVICDHTARRTVTRYLQPKFLEGDGYEIIGEEIMQIRDKVIKQLEKYHHAK